MRCGTILSSLIGHFKDSCIMIYFALVKNFVVDHDFGSFFIA